MTRGLGLAMIVAGVASLSGCLRETEFHCSSDAVCGGGVCEDVGFCSFADTGCASGRRFGELAGGYSEQCAPEQITDCSGYSMVGGLPHLYRAVSPRGWTAQRDTCANNGPNAYLATPRDAGELAAIFSLASQSQVWIGLTDMAGEATFRTVRGDVATFLPWAPGEPDNGPPSEDCVAVDTASGLYSTARCADSYAAICECELP